MAPLDSDHYVPVSLGANELPRALRVPASRFLLGALPPASRGKVTALVWTKLFSLRPHTVHPHFAQFAPAADKALERPSRARWPAGRARLAVLPAGRPARRVRDGGRGSGRHRSRFDGA